MSEFGRALATHTLLGETLFSWYVVFPLLLVLLAAAFGTMFRNRAGRGSAVDAAELINAVEEPLAVLDSEDSVVLANVPFRSMFGMDGDKTGVAEVFESDPELQSAVTDREDGPVAIERDGKTLRYELQSYPIGGDAEPHRRRIILLHDITTHYRRQTQLEAENEQLDQFASLISHDLRNPLDVAIGRTNAVKEVIDDPELETHLRRTQESHQRMKQIITDVLALAREGHSIGETQCVPLETAAMDAWAHVDTDNATIAVNTQLVIEADRERLTRIFENLFRNAIQHGGGDVHVVVGTFEDETGFFVSDDGAGIDTDEPSAVLEAGYTGNGVGTGLGLAIVDGIAEAHGWTVEVTTSAEGGARFEFSNVELVREAVPARNVD